MRDAGADGALTALTDEGIDELSDMLAAAWQSVEHWRNFLDDSASDSDVIARVKDQSLR